MVFSKASGYSTTAASSRHTDEVLGEIGYDGGDRRPADRSIV
jgi:hypothetical protein